MSGFASIFLDVTLPSAATWFYFSAILAVACFFKFARLMSVRNLDVAALFALVPGLLLLVESAGASRWGYLALFLASGYFLVRCLFDLALVRRPALAPNLSLGGLFWLGAALLLSLTVVPVRHEPQPAGPADLSPTPADEGRREVQDALLAGRPSEVRIAVERGLALACHLSVVVGLVLVGWRHFDSTHAGAAAAGFYLMLPYTHLLMPYTVLGAGRWDHALPMAFMVWMVLAYRRPTLAGVFLGLAAGCVFFPVWTLPVWLSFYRGRGAARFAVAFALTALATAGVLAVVVWLHGGMPRALYAAWSNATWQPWFESPAGMSGMWQGVHWAYRIPVFIVYAAFVVGTLFWPAPKNLAHAIALTAAVLIGMQFWYPDRGGVYVLWYLPFVLLLVFRPNLTGAVPPPLPPDDWQARAAAAGRRMVVRLFRAPEPAAPVG